MAIYNRNLKAPRVNKREEARAKQRERYDDLAHFVWKTTKMAGQKEPTYQEAGIRYLLFRSRVLTKDGHVRIERVQKLAKSLGIHNPHNPGQLPDVYYSDEDVWDTIAEGGSP